MSVSTESYTYGLLLLQTERYRTMTENGEAKHHYESSVCNVKAMQRDHPEAVRDGEAVFVYLMKEERNFGRARTLEL